MDMDHLNIAILGDTHGHLTLAYRVLKRWQEEEAQRIDLILQVGDFGAFPPPYRLDKATKRFAESDPDELGFTAYFHGEPEAEEILSPDAAEHRRIDADMFSSAVITKIFHTCASWKARTRGRCPWMLSRKFTTSRAACHLRTIKTGIRYGSPAWEGSRTRTETRSRWTAGSATQGKTSSGFSP